MSKSRKANKNASGKLLPKNLNMVSTVKLIKLEDRFMMRGDDINTDNSILTLTLFLMDIMLYTNKLLKNHTRFYLTNIVSCPAKTLLMTTSLLLSPKNGPNLGGQNGRKLNISI